MARSDGTPFSVEILEGSSAGLTIPLEGRSAPYGAGAGGSISFGTKQRTKLVWNQGNPNATHLIFGPTLDPTTINGIWKERFLGEDVPIDLVETFESLVSRGLQVRVTWQTIERIGIANHFVWNPGNPTGGLTDIAWQVTFEWSRAGGFNRLFVPTVGSTRKPFRDGLSGIANSFAQYRSFINGFIFEIGSFAGNIRATANNTVTQLRSLVDSGQAIANFLTDTSIRLAGANDAGNADLLEQGSMSTDAMIDNVGDVITTMGSASSLNAADSDDVQDVVNLAAQQAAVADAGYNLISDAYAVEVELEADLAPAFDVEIPAVPGEDLRRVARTFYGSADDWMRIAKANGIENGSVIPDDVFTLIIPIGLTAALDSRVGGC